jgi:hypothetical protein
MSIFWSTGIIIGRIDTSPGRWRVRANFHDDKFAVHGRISGQVDLHYDEADLERGIDDLVAAVAELGIRWGVEGTEFAGPYAYIDDENDTSEHARLQREIANHHAERLGWPTSYRLTPA